MKKWICLLLACAMMLSLTACGEVGKVEKLIDAIGEVTIESDDAIKAAQDAFDALEEADKAKVKNAGALEEAHEAYAIALKEKDYNDAAAAFEAGEFTRAKELFVSLADYKDSAARAGEAEKAEFYTEGVSLLDAADYVAAAAAFQSAAGYADAAEKLFEAGLALFDNGQYSESAEVFALCENSAKEEYIEYAQGMICLTDKKYEAAQKHFEAAGNLNDAPSMVNSCVYMQAEENMDKGYLNTAKALYAALPADFSYNNGKSAGERLSSLEKFNDFVELCGIWNSKDMDSSVRQTHKSTGLWDQWDGDGWDYTVQVTCVLNEDETATLSAKAQFWHYTNYSSLSKNLKTTNDDWTFTHTGTSVPSKMDFSLNLNAEYSGSLTIAGKTFALEYTIVDKNSSMHFTYTFKSFGTYDSLVKAL